MNYNSCELCPISSYTHIIDRGFFLNFYFFAFSQYRAADTLSIMMLRSIYGYLSSLLTVDGGYSEQDPAEKLTNILRNYPSSADLNSVVSSLLTNGKICLLTYGLYSCRIYHCL